MIMTLLGKMTVMIIVVGLAIAFLQSLVYLADLAVAAIGDSLDPLGATVVGGVTVDFYSCLAWIGVPEAISVMLGARIVVLSKAVIQKGITWMMLAIA